MKRFALKRITALVLALVMTLSLLPMTVWATEGSDPSDMSNIFYREGWDSFGNWRNDRFHMAAGERRNLQFATSGEAASAMSLSDWTVGVDNANIGAVTKDGDTVSWNLSGAIPGASGNITLTQTGADEPTYKMPVRVDQAVVGVYSAMPDNSDLSKNYMTRDNYWRYTYIPSDEDQVFYFLLNDWVSFKSSDQPDGITIENDKLAKYTIPSGTYGDKTVTVQLDGNPPSWTINFKGGTDPSDMSDIFYREGWDSFGNWRNDRFHMAAGESRYLQFAISGEATSAMSLSDWTVGVDNANIGAVTKDGDTVSWNLDSAIPGTNGNITLTKGDVTHTVPVRVDQAVFGVYSNVPSGENLAEGYVPRDNYGRYTYIPSDEDQVFYFLLNDWVSFKSSGQPDGIRIENDKLAKYTIPAGTYGNQSVTVQLDGNPTSWTVNFKEGVRHNTVVGSNGLTGEKQSYHPVPIGNTGYYVGPGFYLYGELDIMAGGYQVLSEGGQIDSGFAVGLWKMAPDGVTLELLEGAELAAVSARFNDTEGKTTLKMDIQLVAADNAAGKEYPFTREITQETYPEYYEALKGENKYPLAKVYQFTQYSAGVWCLTVTGTYTDVDGTKIPITAYGRDEKRIIEINDIQIPAQATPEATVAYINEKLQAYKNDTDSANIVNLSLPAGTLRGYIDVPEDLYWVILHGQTDANNNILTTLEGGVIANNSDTRAMNMRFVGAGSEETTWANAESWNGSNAPNKAIYGIAGGSVGHCSFTGYDCAIEMQGGIIGVGGETDENGYPVGDTGSFFYDNKVAIKQSIKVENFFFGDTQYWKMVMVNNGTDIYFEKTDGMCGYAVEIDSAIFVRNDNKNSIHNTGGSTFFMPMLAFANSKNDSNNGNKDPKVDGNVSIAPYYTLTAAGKDALITNLNVEAMLENPTYKEEWISTERSFPRSWICPANPNKELYSVPTDEITEEVMTIDIIDNYDDDEYVGTIKLKKNKNK